MVVALLAFSVSTFAQEAKIAHVNTQEIFNAMPEVSAMESELANLQKGITDELKRLEDEYNKKYTEFMQQADSLPESIKVRRMQEVQELQQRIETFYQQSRQDVAKKQQDLQAPIEKKIADAIQVVGEEQNYTYILQDGVFLFISPSSINATPLVRTKLGLK